LAGCYVHVLAQAISKVVPGSGELRGEPVEPQPPGLIQRGPGVAWIENEVPKSTVLAEGVAGVLEALGLLAARSLVSHGRYSTGYASWHHDLSRRDGVPATLVRNERSGKLLQRCMLNRRRRFRTKSFVLPVLIGVILVLMFLLLSGGLDRALSPR
jgi:hypothetical protein